MRRPFKSYLRHSLNKRRVVSGPSEPEEIEVTVLPEWDTVLHYDGSPIMAPGTVNDPGNTNVVRGENQSYQLTDKNGNERDWIAIGLGTDNEQIDKFRSPNPIDDTVDPDDDITDGVVYTNTGPTRSVLSFNLEDIPAGAIIVSAELELVPVTDKSTGDVWDEFDGENTNVWPDTGVQCEILNLIRDTEETCTWNTSSNASTTINGFDYPLQENRWHRQPNSETLPNPFGAMQNSKRWDVQEGSGLFLPRYNGTDSSTLIDNQTLEKYGHVGYGSMGGGAVENVPANKNDLDDFEITKDAHDNQMTTGAGVPAIQSFDVSRSVRYAHENQAGRCSLLLRATHWDVTDLNEDQTEELFAPPVLELDSIGLEDATDTDDSVLDTTVEISNDAIVRFTPATFDEDGDDSTVDPITWLNKANNDGWDVTYDWRVSYPPITNLSFDVTLTRGGTTTTIWNQDGQTESNIGVFELGDILNITNISSDGGFGNVHRFEFYIGDGILSGRDGGLGSSLVIVEGDVPGAGTGSISVFFNVDAQAQGANLVDDPNGTQFFPSQAAGDPASQQGGGSTEPILLGTIEAEDFEITPPSFNSNLDIQKDDAVITVFDSPLDLASVYRLTYTFTITDIRPGFDWNDFPDPTQEENYTFNNVVTDTETGTTLILQTESDTKTVNSTTAQNVIVVEFTGQALVDGGILKGNDCEYAIGVTNYKEKGIDLNGGEYEDLFSENPNIFQFSVEEDNTTNDFDIKNPAKRRGVFTTTNLAGPLLNLSGGAEERLRLSQGPSLVKTNMFQRELAPCQLNCDGTGTFKTSLIPIEEASRFSDIQATKNKFAQLNTDSDVVSIDDSNILLQGGSTPAVQGSVTATISLFTSGGAGEMVTRQRNGANIVLPSDLAVYYYNESGTDIGWVYYRALSKKLNPSETTNTIGAGDLIDYTDDDFNVTNTDDGMKFIAWEKIAGDVNDQAGFIANPLNESNTAGAHIFLLDNRYDFAETPDVSTWPIPFTDAFPLGTSVNSENTPVLPTGLQARNNPSLLETFAREETKWNVGDEDEGIAAGITTSPVLSATSSVLDVVEWKINSLDSGGTDTQQSEPSLIRTTEGANPPSVDTASTWDIACPTFPVVGTRDDFGRNSAGGQITAPPDDKSLFVCLNSVDTNGAQAGEGGIEFKTYTDDNFGLGSFGLGTIPALGVDTGARMERELEGFLDAEYCNLKSHFWNGLADDTTASGGGGVVDKPFTTNDSGLSGKLPLFWRRKDDCGTNQTDDNRYFKDLFDDGSNPPIRVTSDLDRPLGLDGVGESEAYHGINIAYGTFHTDYIDSLGTNGVDSGAIPILDYVVEVIRGGSVYHRDIYRLANGQSEWSDERSIAGECFPCNKADILDITLECNNPSDAGQFNSEQQLNKMDTLYQVGTDGLAWKEGWYNPSDWRAGDIIRIYAIQPRLVGDKVFKIKSGTFGDSVEEELQVVSNPEAAGQISPTPLIQRIKKFCPVGEWDPKPDCCNEVPAGVERCADETTVCVVVCTIPPGNGVGGIDFSGNQL